MAKIEESLINPRTNFVYNGLEYKKGSWEFYYTNKEKEVSLNEDLDKSKIKVGIRNTYIEKVLQSPLPINLWVDSNNTPFTDLSDLLRKGVPIISFSTDAKIGLTQRVDTFGDLVSGTLEGDLAYVEDSQGTQWLPNTLGGTYYPAGWYVWNGVSWVSDRNAIAKQLQDNIDNILSIQTDQGDKYRTTSTTTNEIVPTGFLDFLIDIGLSYIPNQKVLLDASADNYMIGHVESYNQFTGELRVHIEHKKGSGTFSSWNIGLGSVIIDPVVWGAIGGSILDQTDLQDALLTWDFLKDTWSIEPNLNTTLANGDVYNYTLNNITRYRFVPTVYNPTQDAFYESFDGSTLTNLIITRG